MAPLNSKYAVSLKRNYVKAHHMAVMIHNMNDVMKCDETLESKALVSEDKPSLAVILFMIFSCILG